MKKQEYIKKYEEYRDLFKEYFNENAELYWEIYKFHYSLNYSYEELEEKYPYSVSTIKRILKRVESFLERPEEKIGEMDYSIDKLTGEVMIPKKFIDGFYSLSLNARKILYESIYLYQNGMKLKIPRSHILSFSSQYAIINRRTVLFDELRNCQIILRDGKVIKIYETLKDDKGSMRFEFTKESLELICVFFAG